MLFAICQCWCPLFRLLRLSDLALGGFEKVKYYVCQIDRLLDTGLSNVLAKWQMPDCPSLKLVLASERKIARKMGDGREKTKGLEEDDEKMEDDGKC